MKQLFLFYLLFIVFMNQAYAYLDPGTGSILLQGLIAGIGGLIFWFASIKRQIIAFFHKIFPSNKGE